MKEEEQDRRRHLNGNSGVEEEEDEDLSATVENNTNETVADPLNLPSVQPTMPAANGEGTTGWSCLWCNGHAAEISLHKQQRASVPLSWGAFLVPQYCQCLGLFRLVPYAWMCRPVQLSALYRQLARSFNDDKKLSLIQPVHEDASRTEEVVVSSPGFDDQHKKVIGNALNVESEADKLIQCSSTAPTDTISEQEQEDNDETSTLAGEIWTDDDDPDDKEAPWEISMSEDGDDDAGDFSPPCNTMGAARGAALTRQPCAVDVSSAAETKTSTICAGEDRGTVFITKEGQEESDSLNPPCIVRRESAEIMENIIHQAESNTSTTAMQPADMSFSEQDDSSHKTFREISDCENLFRSPATHRNCVPELISAERLSDLLDTSTQTEDHVRDFSDLLGRDFDALCEAYFDLDQPQQQSTVEINKVTSIDKDESERELQCIADLAFLGL